MGKDHKLLLQVKGIQCTNERIEEGDEKSKKKIDLKIEMMNVLFSLKTSNTVCVDVKKRSE